MTLPFLALKEVEILQLVVVPQVLVVVLPGTGTTTACGGLPGVAAHETEKLSLVKVMPLMVFSP
jgi:hypothetical protein